jgi:Domain of unknown function (DUF4279)
MSQSTPEIQELVKQCAIAEVLQPKLNLTRQLLRIDRLVLVEGVPLVLLVEQVPEQDVFRVYFSIQDEPYYFVVVVSQEQEQFIADFAFHEAKVRAYLSIQSQILEPSVITERTGLMPTRSQQQGEPIGSADSPLRFAEHRWYFEPQANIPGNLDDKLGFLLDRLESSQPQILALSESCDICIIICYEAYHGSMGGWHLTQETMQRIVALGADVDLDLYARGPSDGLS